LGPSRHAAAGTGRPARRRQPHACDAEVKRAANCAPGGATILCARLQRPILQAVWAFRPAVAAHHFRPMPNWSPTRVIWPVVKLATCMPQMPLTLLTE